MLPLEGVRVVAVEQYGAGPFGTMQLADLGAEVVKVENIAEGGDVGRYVRHPKDPLPEGDSLFFQAFNRNKKSLALDLKQQAGREVLHDLARSADGLLDNLRGDRPAKLGLTYEALKAVNPAIVCVHLSAYGSEGPRAAWPGYDYLMQAEAGYLSVTGEPDTPPARMGLSMVDLATGVQAALAMTSGILAARAGGRGMDLDVSLYDTAMSNLGYLACWYLTAGVVQGREPRSSHPNLTPSQLYRTRDGWLFIMCNKEKFWGELADALGRPEWKDDPRFRDFAARLTHRETVTEMLDEALSAKTTAEWLEALQGPGAGRAGQRYCERHGCVLPDRNRAPSLGGASERPPRRLRRPADPDRRCPARPAGARHGHGHGRAARRPRLQPGKDRQAQGREGRLTLLSGLAEFRLRQQHRPLRAVHVAVAAASLGHGAGEAEFHDPDVRQLVAPDPLRVQAVEPRDRRRRDRRIDPLEGRVRAAENVHRDHERPGILGPDRAHRITQPAHCRPPSLPAGTPPSGCRAA